MGGASLQILHHNIVMFTVCEATLERDHISLARSRRRHTTTGLLGKQSMSSLNDLSGVSVIT